MKLFDIDTAKQVMDGPCEITIKGNLTSKEPTESLE